MVVAIKAIIGLGNPGPQYYYNRHSIGFRVLDALAGQHNASWRARDEMAIAEINVHGNNILLVKPQTFMNASGQVIPWLSKQGIKPENLLVIHDELEFPFGKLGFKIGGSARGHNGLRSIIASCGDQFERLRFGIGRPENKEDVPNYVLQNFIEDSADVDQIIMQAVKMLEDRFYI